MAASPISTIFLRPAGTNLLLALLAMLLLFPGTQSLPLMDRDEPKFAQATVEMMDRGTWTVPYFNDAYRFDKPPLTYWWMRLHYLAFGVHPWSARLHSVAAAGLTAMVIAALGRWMFNARAGLLAGTGWLACLQIMVHVGRLCVADMPMILFVALTGYALARLLLPEQAPARFGRWWWLLAAARIGGFLAKGPIALIVPALGLLLTRWAFGRGHRFEWSRLHPAALLPVFLLGIGAWGIPALLETQGLFWKIGMGEHVIERGTRSFNGRFPIPGFYFATIFLSLLPWAGLLPEALRRDGTPRSKGNAFLLGWFAAPYVIFSFYSTQLPHYVAPGFPAFFLLLFRSGGLPRPSTTFSRRFAWGVAGFFLLLGVAVLAATRFVPAEGAWVFLRSLATLLGWLVLICGVAAALAMRGSIYPVLPCMLAVSLQIHAAGQMIGLFHPTTLVAGILNQQPPQTQFQAAVFTEPSLVFHTRAGWKFKGRPEHIPKVIDWLHAGSAKRPRAAVFLLREWSARDAVSHLRAGGSLASVPAGADHRQAILPAIDGNRFHLHTIEGYNNGRTSWAEVLVVTPKELPASAAVAP